MNESIDDQTLTSAPKIRVIGYVISRLVKQLFATVVFYLVFFALGNEAFFERSIVTLIYLTFIKIDRNAEIFHLKIAATIFLSWLVKNGDNSDKNLLKAARKLLHCWESQDLLDYLLESEGYGVVADEIGRFIADIIELAAMLGMLGWLVYTYYGQV